MKRKLFIFLFISIFILSFVSCKKSDDDNNNSNNSSGGTQSEPQQIEAVSIKLNDYSLTMRVGESVTLSYQILPNNATSKVSFTSSNQSIATVDNYGQIVAKNIGSCVITVSTDNGLRSTCSITVIKAYTELSGISLSKYSDTIELGETQTYQLILDNQGSVDKVDYTLSNTGIISVSNGSSWTTDGKTNIYVKAISSGKCTITFKVTTPTGKTFTKDLVITVKETIVSFNEEFKYSYAGFNIKFGSTYSFVYIRNQFSDYNGKKCIKIPVTITNLGTSTKNLNRFCIDTFSPKGVNLSMSISSYFDEDIFDYKLLPDASASGYFYFLYDGSGIYTMTFDFTTVKAQFNIE